VARARVLAEHLDASLAIVDKRRPKPNVAEVMNVIGDVKGKPCVLVDDLVDTAGTICQAAQALIDRGATSVRACCTHGVLSGPAIERLKASPIEELVITNTIPVTAHDNIDKITVLSVAPLFAEAIRRIYEELSVSILFE
jgi:ribose-phosphate pyrophosphokinase